MSAQTTLIRNARIVNEGILFEGDLRIENGRIAEIGKQIRFEGNAFEIDARGMYLLPGIVDDQVHFREPGLTHKANIASESRAGLAGGVTSFMEMPNTQPPAVTKEELEEKYAIAAETAFANYSFFMGTTNDNYDELMKIDQSQVCGIKIFMGSSTGNMLVDRLETLESIFANTSALIATHCEDEATVRHRVALFKEKFGENAPPGIHPMVRNEEACYLSSSFAADLARKNGTRLHILHISTAKEVSLFDRHLPLKDKLLTSEACVHHLTFSEEDYETLGNRIKCNPAIKSAADREGIWEGLLGGAIDIIATDHAPHTAEEKARPYFDAPAGLPLVQHSLDLMFRQVRAGRMSLEQMVYFMSHAPAICFRLKERGFIREGYFADLVLFDPNETWTVGKNNIYYKCGWSPLENWTFTGRVQKTWVNGQLAYDRGVFQKPETMRLAFEPR